MPDLKLFKEGDLNEQMKLIENHGLELADRYFSEFLADTGDKKLDLNTRTRSMAAILMANTARASQIPLDKVEDYFEASFETGDIAAYNKYAFPLVRAILPQLAVMDLCSVQPMLGPTSQIFYLKFLYAQTRGNTTANTELWSTVRRNYTSSTIESEVLVASAPATTATYVGSLGHRPVTANTVSITDGTIILTDNGSGTLSDGGSSTGSINYTTGQYTVTFSTAPTTGVAITATYDINLESNPDIANIKVQLTSSTVTAKTRKLKADWSAEASQDLLALHGLSAALEITGAMASELAFEIDIDVIRKIEAYALNAYTDTTARASLSPVISGSDYYAWDKTPPTGVPYVDHKTEFFDVLNRHANYIFQLTGRARPTWVVLASDMLDIVQSQDGWDPAPVTLAYGVYYAGNLGPYKVYVDPTMTSNSFLMGYNGPSFLHAGYVYAPYVPIYWTPTVELEDSVIRKGAMTRSGTSAVNPFFIKNRIKRS